MDYRNSDMCHAIEEYIHNPRYKEVLRYRFCEGRTYEEIAGRVNYSPQHVKHLCRMYRDYLMDRL